MRRNHKENSFRVNLIKSMFCALTRSNFPGSPVVYLLKVPFMPSRNVFSPFPRKIVVAVYSRLQSRQQLRSESHVQMLFLRCTL